MIPIVDKGETRKDIFGWFDTVSETPAHDPGLETICIFCAKQLSRPMKTISLMKHGDNRSFFYRCHKECYDALSESDITLVESSLIDAI